MSFFRRRSSFTAPYLSFERGEFDFISDEGAPVRGVGFNIHDEHARGFTHDDEVLATFGIRIFNVAGVSFRRDVLCGPGCEAGKAVVLVPEPGNERDPNAVGVWTEAGRAHVGYVPRAIAPDIAAALRREPLQSFVLWEWIGEDGQRSGLTILACPASALANSEGLP